jgi:hypothetical protein
MIALLGAVSVPHAQADEASSVNKKTERFVAKDPATDAYMVERGVDDAAKVSVGTHRYVVHTYFDPEVSAQREWVYEYQKIAPNTWKVTGSLM